MDAFLKAFFIYFNLHAFLYLLVTICKIASIIEIHILCHVTVCTDIKQDSGRKYLLHFTCSENHC